MPRRRDRDLAQLLEKHRIATADRIAPKQDWIQFLKDAPKPLLVTMLSGLTDNLSDSQRRGLHAELAVSNNVLNYLLSSRRFDEASIFLDGVAVSISNPRAWWRRRKQEGCRGIILLTHLQVITETLKSMPVRVRNPYHIKRWLHENLPPLFDKLAKIDCTSPHKAHAPADSTLGRWASLRKAPLAEHILAYHHRKSPKTIHKLVSRGHVRLRSLFSD